MLLLGLLSVLLQGCYVLHLAGGQLRLINDQKPLDRAIAEESDASRRALLGEVEHIKRFARDVLGFSPADSYAGYFEVKDDGYLTLVLSAAPRDRLVPITRWYPFAGRVPYRSYFDEGRAKRAQAELEAQGYDTFLHPSAAYSTLGFFRDPITTPMLDRAPPCPPASEPEALDGCRLAGLAETLLHELTHRHAYAPGHTDFNEQLASFVGRKAALEYLMWRGLYTPKLRARLEMAYQRQRAFEELVGQASHTLQQLYDSPISFDEKVARRQPVFAELAIKAAQIYPDSKPGAFMMNNARILQYGRYDRNSQDMQALWKRANGSWPRFWAIVQLKIGDL